MIVIVMIIVIVTSNSNSNSNSNSDKNNKEVSASCVGQSQLRSCGVATSAASSAPSGVSMPALHYIRPRTIPVIPYKTPILSLTY